MRSQRRRGVVVICPLARIEFIAHSGIGSGTSDDQFISKGEHRSSHLLKRLGRYVGVAVAGFGGNDLHSGRGGQDKRIRRVVNLSWIGASINFRIGIKAIGGIEESIARRACNGDNDSARLLIDGNGRIRALESHHTLPNI